MLLSRVSFPSYITLCAFMSHPSAALKKIPKIGAGVVVVVGGLLLSSALWEADAPPEGETGDFLHYTFPAKTFN